MLAPQEIRTFFISSRSNLSKPLFQQERFADLLLDVLIQNRAKHRFELHEFVIMHDHLHLLITPAPEHSLEKCVQFIKGGFSFRAGRELDYKANVWQESFADHRVKDVDDYVSHVIYIHRNPVEAGYCKTPLEYKYSSASLKDLCDPAPVHFRG